MAEIANDRCRAANAAARASREISRRDANQITELGVALVDLTERIALLQDNLRRAEGSLNASVDELRRRIEFHTGVGLGGVRRTFVSGFAERFYLVRERSITPLVDGDYDTVSQLERMVKQLTFTSTTETIARKVLYFMTDNVLSGKLETAIQALDNFTKVYYSFLNTQPIGTVQPITPDGRYDIHLLPYSLLSKTQNTMKVYYTGISENIAGLIENILALKAILKDVYQLNIVNNTLFDQARKTFIQRTFHVKHFTTLFEEQIVQNCIDDIDAKIKDLEHINDTLNHEYLLVRSSIESISSIIGNSYTDASNDVLAFSRLAQQFLKDSDVLKSSLTNSNTDVFTQSSALTHLMEALGSLSGTSLDLHGHWFALGEAVRAAWSKFIREDLLTNFYLNLYNDVTDMVNDPKRADQFRAIFGRTSAFYPPRGGGPPVRPAEYVPPSDFYTLLNADVAVTNVDVKMSTVAEEFRGYSDQTDYREVVGSARMERLARAFGELKSNLEELQTQCSTTQDLIR